MKKASTDGKPGKGREVRLTQLKRGRWCEVVRVERKAELLEGFCIYPGTRLRLLQKYPAFVVAAEDLEFALEDDLAHAIWIRPGRL